MNFNVYWLAWGIGMAVPFVIKLMNHMLNTVPGQYSFTINLLRFMFLDVKVATTTFISFTLELVFGAWYIDGLPLPYMADFVLPSHWVMALFLAAILEVIAPILVRGLVSWTVDKVNKLRGIQSQQKPTEE